MYGGNPNARLRPTYFPKKFCNQTWVVVTYMSRNSFVRSSSHLGQKATISHSSRSRHSKFSSLRGQCVQPRARYAQHDSNGSIIHAPSRTWVLAPLYTLSSTLYDYHMLPWASSTLLLQFGVHRVFSYIQTPRSKQRCPPLLAPYWPPIQAEFQALQLLLFCNQTFVFLEPLYALLNTCDGYIDEVSRKSQVPYWLQAPR